MDSLQYIHSRKRELGTMPLPVTKFQSYLLFMMRLDKNWRVCKFKCQVLYLVVALWVTEEKWQLFWKSVAVMVLGFSNILLVVNQTFIWNGLKIYLFLKWLQKLWFLTHVNQIRSAEIWFFQLQKEPAISAVRVRNDCPFVSELDPDSVNFEHDVVFFIMHCTNERPQEHWLTRE